MGTTAEKLEYLNTTKQLIKESINLTNANITTEPFRQYASILKDRLPIIIKDTSIIWNNYEKTTGTGTSFSLSAYDSLFEMALKGDTVQDGTPTPSAPVPVNVVSGDNTIDICGKNLLPISTLATQTKNGITFTNNNNGSYTFNGTATAYTTFLIFQDLSFSGNYTYVLKDTATSGFTMYIQKSTGAGIGDATTYKTIDNDVGRLLIGIQPNTVLNNLIITPYVYKGTYDSSTTYEPYIGNTYPIYLGVENSWKPSKAIQGTFDNNTVLASKRIVWFDKEVSNGETMTIICNNSNLRFAVGRTTTNTQSSSNTQSQNSGWQTGTYTITFNSNGYACLTISKTDDSAVAISSLNDNDFTITYNGNHISNSPIELCKIGTYQDKIIRSENLLNYKNLEVGIGSITPITDGWKLDSSSTQADECEGIIPITLTPGKKYYASFKASNITSSFVALELYKKVGQVWNYITSASATEEGTFKFNFIAPTEEIRLHLYLEEGTAEATELYVGEIDAPYIPYGSKGKWYLHKEIGKVVLDGSENWAFNYNNRLMVYIFNTPLALFKQDTNIDAFTTHYIPKYYGTLVSANYDYAISYGTTTGDRFCIRDIRYCSPRGSDTPNGTIADFKTWLSSNNVIVYYVLATSTNTEITDGSLINQLNAVSLMTGLNNISVSGDLPAILDLTALKYN